MRLPSGNAQKACPVGNKKKPARDTSWLLAGLAMPLCSMPLLAYRTATVARSASDGYQDNVAEQLQLSADR